MARPRSPQLSRESIVSAALHLIDESGDFSFPRIARRLGVSQSALYNHIHHREHIIELLRGRIFRDQVRPDVSRLGWEDALRELVEQYRRALAAHPRLVPILVGQTVRDPGVSAMYEDIAATLERAGLTAGQLIPAISVIDYLVLGSTLDLTAPATVWDADPQRFPTLTEAIAAADHLPARADIAFSLGVDVLIAGLRSAIPTLG